MKTNQQVSQKSNSRVVSVLLALNMESQILCSCIWRDQKTVWKKFLRHQRKLHIKFVKKKQSNRYFRDPVPERSKEAQHCWICDGQFGTNRDFEDDKVVDHCHNSGMFLGFAYPECNLKRQTIIFIPVLAHNSSNYNLHHVCQYIHKFKPGCKIDVIPSVSLRNKTIMLTQDEWEHAKKVYERFKCANLGGYHNLYLKTDTLSLACAVEVFRSLCYKTYGLDSAHYFTCSHLSGDAFLKKCWADIELLRDRTHLEMVENMVSGAVSSVFGKRFFKANNKYVPKQNYNEYDTYEVLLDANNLYDGVREKFHLPLNSFETLSEFNLNRILNTPDYSEYGYSRGGLLLSRHTS